MIRKVWVHNGPTDYPKARYWFYSKEDWDPVHRWHPSLGGDEWCRHTVVLPVPFKGWICISLWECRDKACESCEYDCERK